MKTAHRIELDPRTKVEINKMLSMTAEDICNEYKCGYDVTLYTETVQLTDDVEVDIKLCNGTGIDKPWTEAVVFYQGHEVGCTEPEDEFVGQWIFDIGDICFFVDVE